MHIETSVEEEVRFNDWTNKMNKRSEMRLLLMQAVKEFNKFNEQEFPGQYLPMSLCVEDYAGIRKVR